MPQNGLEYSIPMKGSGVYNANSELQRDLLTEGLDLLLKASIQATNNASASGRDSLTIAEYGSSHGANSLHPLEVILQVVLQKDVDIFLNDRPENDFTTLALTLTEWEDTLDREKHPQNLLILLQPRSFYKRLNRCNTVDIGFTFTCVHFLEDMPLFTDSHFTAVRSQQTARMIQAQAQTDLRKFLRLRAAEIVPSGQLLMSLISPSFGQPHFFESGPGHACRLALLQMQSDRLLSESDLESCVVPVYFRSIEEIMSTLNSMEVEQQWQVIATKKAEVKHPSWKSPKQLELEGKDSAEHGYEYATTMVDWFIAIFEGFFWKALSARSASRSNDEITDLIQEMKNRAIKIFVVQNKDEAVYLPSIFVLLERKT